MSLRSWSSVKTSYEVPLPLSIISRDSTKSSTSPMLGTPRIPLKTSSEKAERTCSFTVDMAVTLGRERKIVNLCVFTSTWRTFGCGLSGLWVSVVIQTPLGVWDTTYHVCECEFRPCNRVASRLWRLVSGKGKCPARSRRRARYTTQRRDQRPATTMNSFHPGESSSHPFVEPTPLPASIPKVNELGATSAPLKSAAFFIGAYCKEFNGGSYVSMGQQLPMWMCRTEDFMLCKAENRDPAHCLKEGRRVTRCATDLCALSRISLHPTLTILRFNFFWQHYQDA